MKKTSFISLLALPALLMASPTRADIFSPVVDAIDPNMSIQSHLAVWVNTDEVIPSGNTLAVHFPPGWTVNLPDPDTCDCIFWKYTYAPNAFTAGEVSYTAASLGSVVGNSVYVEIPDDIYPGPFYVRFSDFPASGIKNPGVSGTATVMVELHSQRVSSSAFYIGSTNSARTYTTFSGTVTNNAGEPLPGALVYVGTDTTGSGDFYFPPVTTGPSAAATEAMDLTINSYVLLTDTDGEFSALIPPTYGEYGVKAEYWGYESVSYTPRPFVKWEATPTTVTDLNGGGANPLTRNFILVKP